MRRAASAASRAGSRPTPGSTRVLYMCRLRVMAAGDASCTSRASRGLRAAGSSPIRWPASYVRRTAPLPGDSASSRLDPWTAARSSASTATVDPKREEGTRRVPSRSTYAARAFAVTCCRPGDPGHQVRRRARRWTGSGRPGSSYLGHKHPRGRCPRPGCSAASQACPRRCSR